jgi:hypothetical protein
LALGIADALLLIAFLAGLGPRKRAMPRDDAVIAGLWAIALFDCMLALRGALDASRTLWLGVPWIANALLGFAILRGARPVLVAAVPAAALLVSTAWFNPLARGGSEHLLHGAVSEMITELDQRAGGRSVWISYGDQNISNLFRMLGVHALDGVHAAPQLALWKELDPEGAYRSHYNRFAHVFIGLAHAGRHFISTTDTLMAEIDPTDPVLDRLGVTHLLVRTSELHLSVRFGGFEPAARAGFYTAYERPLRKRASLGVSE